MDSGISKWCIEAGCCIWLAGDLIKQAQCDDAGSWMRRMRRFVVVELERCLVGEGQPAKFRAEQRAHILFCLAK